MDRATRSETRDREFYTVHNFFIKSSMRLIVTPLCPVVTLTLAPLMLDVIFKTQSLNIAAAYEKCFCIPRGQKTMHKVQILDHAYLILQSKYWGGVQLHMQYVPIRDYKLFSRVRNTAVEEVLIIKKKFCKIFWSQNVYQVLNHPMKHILYFFGASKGSRIDLF